MAIVRGFMDSETGFRRLRARQVGMLMQAYRRSHAGHGVRRGLSQERLLELMGRVDPRYMDRYDRSTVSRWESGEILPSVERIRVFGRALGLSPAEVSGLVSLAGLDTAEGRVQTAQSRRPPKGAGSDKERLPDSPGDLGQPSPAAATDGTDDIPNARYLTRYAWSRFLLPGLFVALAGYFIATLGWNSSFMLAVYVGGAISALTAQGFWRLRRSDDLAELLYVTVFFQLSIPLLHAPLTRMDAYGLYSLGGLAGTSIPFTLSLLLNLLMATLAGSMFVFLRRWQYSCAAGARSVYSKAAWMVLPPIGLVYGVLLAFSNVGFWIVGLGLFTLVAGVFIALVVLRDRDVSVGEWDRKFLLSTAVAVTIVLSALGLVAILVTYAQPSSYAVTDQGLFYSWNMDYEALGYSPEEYVERSRLAVTWASLTTVAYMVIVMGGKLIVTIYRLDVGVSPPSASAPAVVTDGDSMRRRPKGGSGDQLRSLAGRLFAMRVLRRRGGRTRPASN